MVKNGLENLKNPKAFIKYSSNMQDVYKNIENATQGENVIYQ